MKLATEVDGGISVYAGHQKVKVGEPLWIYGEAVDTQEVKVVGLTRL